MDRNKLFGKVIQRYRKNAGMTQAQLSEASGIDQGGISRLERGHYQTPEAHVEALAAALSVRSSDILRAVENGLDVAAEDMPAPVLAMPGITTIPLVGWVRAGMWDQIENPFDADVAEGLVQTTAKVSRRSFALRVKGDSMLSPREWPSFPPGTTIIVDPKVQPVDGSLVIAQVDEELEATFKRLATDGGKRYLVPLNPQYPTLPIDRPTRICGVVVAIAERSI